MSIIKKTAYLLSQFSILTVGLVVGSFFNSCDRTRNDKGYEYFPDMVHSMAYETYSPNPNYKDGKTQQPPVAGTINREIVPYPYSNTEEGRARAGQELSNPFTPTAGNLVAGKEKYTIFCGNCHGEKGDGNGYLFTSKRFPIKPANYLSDRVMNLPAGEIYHVITNGYNTMGAHAAQIVPEDRWKIILYLQHDLQHIK
ncbi:MAG: cytochrome c [Bacteroidetes bacterium]|nr:cytochrome c [Bacteroidota bacterium]